MYGKCARVITHVPEMCLVETCQINGSCPFNVPDMFPPVSRGPCPQCQLFKQILLRLETFFQNFDPPLCNTKLIFGPFALVPTTINPLIQRHRVFIDTKEGSLDPLIHCINLETQIGKLFINLCQSLGLCIDSPDVVGLNTLDLCVNQVDHYKEEASRMTNLIIHPKIPLKNSNNHV